MCKLKLILEKTSEALNRYLTKEKTHKIKGSILEYTKQTVYNLQTHKLFL